MIRARLYLFGEQTLIAGPSPHDRPVDPGPPQQRLLLAYLALHPGQPVDRRKLAFTLWPDTTEAAARRTLRQQLHRLRQILASLALPPETLVSRGGQLYFNPGANLWIDAREFERQIFDPRWQIEAIELHRAELLPDRQADWLQPLRSDLREKYMAALRSQIDIANMQRNYPRALYYAHRLLQADPLRESSHRIYMEALYCSGQRSEALQHFTRLTQRLKSELNVAPTPQTVDLYRQIQRGALPGDIPPLMVSPRHMPQAIRQVARLGTSFVGQRDALARLDEALAQTLNGWGQLVIVKGTSGAGKTCLVQTWRQMRAESMLALTGHCAPEETLIPYAPVLGALRAARGHINWQWFPANSPWAGRLRPLLFDPPGEDRSGAASLSPDGLGQFLLALAGRADSVPCLILDDLHHAGETTWQLLAFLGRRCGQAPLLIVAACRPEALSPARRRVLQTLQPRPCAQTITLPPLSPADTARLAALLLPGRRLDKPFLNRLYRATGGNPFFITEYLNAAQSEAPLQPAALQIPPKTVQAAVNLRLNRLPPESKTLLAVAAVVGRTFQFQVLAGAAPSFTENEVLAALETWLQQGLVIERPDGYQFAHEQIQLAAHATLTPAHRREIHAHIAGALTSLPLEPHLKDPARLAFHRQMAQGVTVEELVTPG